MSKSRRIALLLALTSAGFVAGLAGCGGGNLVSGLSGGSVPIGGRSITGLVLLPDSTPVANAVVTIRSLPANTLVQTTATDSQGRFVVTGIPQSNDIDVIVTQPPANLLEAVIPRSDLAANPTQALDIGNVTAFSTLVAEALKLEQAQAPEDADSIDASQKDHLTMQVHGAGYSLETQKQIIGDRNSLHTQALTLLVPTANTELTAFTANPNADTAAAALDGLLGYVRAAHEHETHLKGSLRTSLIAAQLTGKQYSADVIASALQAAGFQNATATQVSAASQTERTQLTALGTLGSGITAFEALVIAADVNTKGGFQLSRGALTTFLSTLLGS